MRNLFHAALQLADVVDWEEENMIYIASSSFNQQEGEFGKISSALNDTLLLADPMAFPHNGAEAPHALGQFKVPMGMACTSSYSYPSTSRIPSNLA